jgi:hypothetical protein
MAHLRRNGRRPWRPSSDHAPTPIASPVPFESPGAVRRVPTYAAFRPPVSQAWAAWMNAPTGPIAGRGPPGLEQCSSGARRAAPGRGGDRRPGWRRRPVEAPGQRSTSEPSPSGCKSWRQRQPIVPLWFSSTQPSEARGSVNRHAQSTIRSPRRQPPASAAARRTNDRCRPTSLLSL